jgi:hypothetical protein
MKFITAIYSKLYNTKFGGRLNRDRHYYYSLKTLVTMGGEFICYTSEEEYDELVEAFSMHTNIEFRKYNLSEFKYHNDIQRIKEENKSEYNEDAVWTYRCVELMWLKMEWLYQESRDYNGKVFWIDAGLSHGGIIPVKYNQNVGHITYENSFENVYAFNPNLLKKLDKLSSKFFAFYCNNRQHKYPDLYANDINLGGSIVAGLMGGSPESIEKVYNEYKSIIKAVLDVNDLIQEEMALTVVFRDNRQMFSESSFDTWYHDDWDCFDRSQKSFSAFFEDVNEWV